MMSLPIIFMVIERNRHNVFDLTIIMWEKIWGLRFPYFEFEFSFLEKWLVAHTTTTENYVYVYSLLCFNYLLFLISNTVVAVVTTLDLYFVAEKYFDFVLLFCFRHSCIYCMNDGNDKKYIQWKIYFILFGSSFRAMMTNCNANYWNQALNHHKIIHQN